MTLFATSRIIALLPLASSLLTAEDFPLSYRELAAETVATFPRSYGSEGVLSASKPADLRNEPPAPFGHPLYGRLWTNAANSLPAIFRLEESQGAGKGHDRLIIDLNRNGDLTDDPVLHPSPCPIEAMTNNEEREEAFFGPILVPAPPGFPVKQLQYFARTHIYNRRALARGARDGLYFGQLRIQAGWCLEAAVNLNGERSRLAIVDCDGDLGIGESWHIKSPALPDAPWDLAVGDAFLQAPGISGNFDNRLFTTECSPYPFTPRCSPFGSFLYVGAKLRKVTLADGMRHVHIEPWTEPLVEVRIGPEGKPVRNLLLARENPAGQWQLMRTSVVKGKSYVPSGSYRVYGCLLEGKAGLFQHVRASAFDRTLTNSFRAESGRVVSLVCGAPLEIKVETRLQEGQEQMAPRVLRISAKAVGAGGETYSAYGVGKAFDRDPRKRVFVITDLAGNKITSGNLEFG
jgi:hypothetical protein